MHRPARDVKRRHGASRIIAVNRVGLAVVLAGALFAGSAFFLLKTSAPDDVGDSNAPNAAGVRDLPPRPDSPTSRGDDKPPPAAPEPPAAPPATRRSPRASVSSTPAPSEAAAPTTATLRIVSDVAGAQVFLNREFVGATPATANDLAPGSYQLNVSAPGFDNHVETLELAAGQREVTIRFREVRLNASVDVVHKHRFGSCRGTLTATTQGIRYATSDKDDGFEAALANLEAFQIDYLNKNLRIQPRKGKRYDFTDPEGNADRLFVFHRDVERARERLKKGDTP
jgi:hypothetical protein